MAETAVAAAPSYSAPRNNPMKLVLGLGIVAAAGYGYYRYWYLPEKMREDLALAAARSGMTPQNYLKTLGSAACQAYGTKFGLPPQASSGICNELAGAAVGVIQSLPQLVSGVAQAAAGGVAALGAGVGSGVQSVAGGVAGGATTLAMAPVNVTGAVLDKTYSGGKTVVKDTYGGVKTVLHDLAPWNWGSGSSKVCRAANNKDVFPNDMAMCKSLYGITDCNACGMLFNLQRMKWPWQ